MKKPDYRKILKITTLVVFIAFVGIQFVPSTRNQSGVSITDADFTRVYKVPVEAENLLKRSCYDCHSNNTNYPWYSNIQPAAWFMEKHIVEGKSELNFSEFGDYSERRRKSKLESIISQIESGEMPLHSYTWLHWDAIVTGQEKQTLVDSIEKIKLQEK